MSLLHNDMLKPETEAAIEALGLTAEQVADRWLGGWPKETLALEKAGKLLEAVKAQAEREAAIYSETERLYSHLARHEIAEMYGLDPAPPAP